MAGLFDTAAAQTAAHSRVPLPPSSPVPAAEMARPTIAGNIDLTNRPQIKTDNGTATVRSITIGIDGGKQAVIPTVIGSKIVGDKEAIEHFRKTGQHLGIFDSPASADKYAKDLSKAQANYYGIK